MHFTCPHCGHTTDVATQYVGRTGPCASCGKQVTVRWGRAPGGGNTLLWILAPLLVVGLLAGVGVYVLLTSLGEAREAQRRAHCGYNLKQIALAMHNHHDVYARLPPAYITDEDGKRLHSWRVLLLPFVGRQDLFQQIRLHEPWDSPHNRQFHSQMPEVYRCPASDNEAGSGYTNYMVAVGSAEGEELSRTAFVSGRLALDRRPSYTGGLPLSAFTDGTSKTIMVVEVVNSKTNWMQPADLQLERQVAVNGARDGSCLSSDHEGHVNVVMADGTVQGLDEDLSAEKLRTMLLRDDRYR